MKTYTKTRSSKYYYELTNELLRLNVAKQSFTSIITPRTFSLQGNTLSTSRIGAGSSDLYKNQFPPDHFIAEYENIIRSLWQETLRTNLNLTPQWVKNPKIKQLDKLHPDFKNKTRAELKEILYRKKPIITKQVVVHGDLCPVNIIFNESGKAIGLIDLGDMHVGDGMLDIAVLSWTIRGNFGRKYEKIFLDRFGLKPNDKTLEYYRLIYDLSLPSYKNWNWIKE